MASCENSDSATKTDEAKHNKLVGVDHNELVKYITDSAHASDRESDYIYVLERNYEEERTHKS